MDLHKISKIGFDRIEDSKKEASFLDVLKKAMFPDGIRDQVNLYSLPKKVKEWPKVTYKEGGNNPDDKKAKGELVTETLDTENTEVYELTKSKMVFASHGDWQYPFVVTIELKDDKLTVVKCEPLKAKGSGYHAMSSNEIFKALGVWGDIVAYRKMEKAKKEEHEEHAPFQEDSVILHVSDFRRVSDSSLRERVRSIVSEGAEKYFKENKWGLNGEHNMGLIVADVFREVVDMDEGISSKKFDEIKNYILEAVSSNDILKDFKHDTDDAIREYKEEHSDDVHVNDSRKELDGYVLVDESDDAVLENYDKDDKQEAIDDAKEKQRRDKLGCYIVYATYGGEYDDDSEIFRSSNNSGKF